MQDVIKYKLSFTAASLRLNEMVKVASALMDDDSTNLNEVRDSRIVFGSVKNRTTEREFREIKHRLEKLTPDQLEVLVHGDLISQKQIAFLGVCKHYDLIRDFTVDVIRDKALVFDYQIRESDFNSFINSKISTHPELEEFSETTLKKGKQVMFRILEQAGIINNVVDKKIQPQLLQKDVIKSIVVDDPKWLRIFLMPDTDIKQLRY
jgi:hypothetical protein